jgi:hypothetical protein
MRTTLELDDDLLAAAKQIARERGQSLGEVISDLARQSIALTARPKVRNGALLFEPRAHTIRPDMKKVNELRDEA